MSTRNSDSSLTILSETPGPANMNISGSRLPSFKQVLFCFMASLEKLKNEDKLKNEKLMRSCANLVSKEVLNHYQKALIPILHENKIAEKIIKLHSDYKSLYKTKPEK